MVELSTYEDPEYGTRGWLAYDGAGRRLAAGGCRVQPGLTAETLSTLAARMALKQRVLGINVGGAKCGLDLDPNAPHKREVLGRFLAFLRTDLMTRFSMGCDMGTRWTELERIAGEVHVPSIKYAVKVAQGFTDDEFFARLALLDAPVGTLTVAQRRAGHALAHAALAIGRHTRPSTGRLTCTLQGFGNLGRAAAYSLAEAGVRIVGVADEHGSVANADGLDIGAMLATPYDCSVPAAARGARRLDRDALFDLPSDLVVLAASEDGMSVPAAERLAAAAVVVGSNCGLSKAAEVTLAARGVPVVPDFIGGIGGSASMEALFGPRWRPTASGLLDSVAGLMHELIGHLVDQADGQTLTVAALELAAAATPSDNTPYGSCPYAIRNAGGHRVASLVQP